jgi:hypothetical protein
MLVCSTIAEIKLFRLSSFEKMLYPPKSKTKQSEVGFLRKQWKMSAKLPSMIKVVNSKPE